METVDFLAPYNRGLDIFDFYLNKRLRIGQHINSPFRAQSDSHGFNLYVNENNGLFYYKDHVSGNFGNALDFVMELFGVDYTQAKYMIQSDLFLRERKTTFTHLDNRRKKTSEESNVVITYQKRHWSRADVAFWQPYCLDAFDKPLFYIHEQFGLYPAEYVTIQRPDYQYQFYYENSCPLYSIAFPSGRVKIYRPLADKKGKWRSTTTTDDVFGLHLLENDLPCVFIMAGNKDTISCTSLLGMFVCIATPSEKVPLPPYLYQVLKAKARKIFVLYDADKTGREATRDLQTLYPEIIDASAPVCVLHQADPTKKDFAHLIQTYRHHAEAIHKLRAYFSTLINQFQNQ